MTHDDGSHESPEHKLNIFQLAAGDVLAQRLEAVALEVRAVGGAQAGIFANNETLGLLAAVLQGTLRKIDQIFELNGFVFTPACSLLLELFQARARGSLLSCSTLTQAVNCPPSVAIRWVKVLEAMHLVETIADVGGDARIALTERGHLKTAEALKLLL